MPISAYPAGYPPRQNRGVAPPSNGRFAESAERIEHGVARERKELDEPFGDGGRIGRRMAIAQRRPRSRSLISNRLISSICRPAPIAVPGQGSAYGAAPNAIAVDANRGVAYVALYNANAIAVVDLSGGAEEPVLGLIPVAYAPSSVALANNQLVVANDKGVGTRFSFETDYGVTGYNTHQDNGTVSIVPVPKNN
jgi:hypothetical protein